MFAKVSRDLGLALGVQLFSQIIEERVVTHVPVDSVQHVDDELLQSHRELREIVARIRSPIFADVMVLILRAQNPTMSDMTITHSVNQLKRLCVVYCSEISTQLIDRRNNSTLSQPRANIAIVVQQNQVRRGFNLLLVTYCSKYSSLSRTNLGSFGGRICSLNNSTNF